MRSFLVALFVMVCMMLNGCSERGSKNAFGDILGKGAKQEKEKQERLAQKAKEHGISVKPGEQLVGISELCYKIDGEMVPIKDAEWDCSKGKCVMVPRKKK